MITDENREAVQTGKGGEDRSPVRHESLVGGGGGGNVGTPAPGMYRARRGVVYRVEARGRVFELDRKTGRPLCEVVQLPPTASPVPRLVHPLRTLVLEAFQARQQHDGTSLAALWAPGAPSKVFRGARLLAEDVLGLLLEDGTLERDGAGWWVQARGQR